MPRVKVDEIINHLKGDIKRALCDALKEVAPTVTVDENKFFQAFKRAVSRRCATWERVSDSCVDVD